MIQTTKYKILFFGTSEFAVPALRDLIENGYEIKAVIITPDKPAGRAQQLTPSPVKVFAESHGLTILQPDSLKSLEHFERFERLEPDLCVLTAYGKIIPEKFLAVPKFGFINIHPSLLPKYRGPSPIQTAILNGEKETGVTIIKLDAEVDHGPILEKQELRIRNQGYRELSSELAELGAKLLVETLPRYLNGEIELQEQDHAQATFTKMLTREDGKINWNRPAREIHNQIGALNPEPGTWTLWNGLVLKIVEAKSFSHDYEGKTGEVVKPDGQIIVNTGNGVLAINKVQLEGKKETDIKSFLNGNPQFIGSILG